MSMKRRDRADQLRAAMKEAVRAGIVEDSVRSLLNEVIEEAAMARVSRVDYERRIEELNMRLSLLSAATDANSSVDVSPPTPEGFSPRSVVYLRHIEGFCTEHVVLECRQEQGRWLVSMTGHAGWVGIESLVPHGQGRKAV